MSFSNNPVTLEIKDAMAGANASQQPAILEEWKVLLGCFLSWADWVLFLTPQATVIHSHLTIQHNNSKPFLTSNKALLPSLFPHELFDFKTPFQHFTPQSS